MSKANNTETDGQRLQGRFEALKTATGMKKAEFARVFKIPGGASMISQHISGHRPIGLDAMVAYAKGFQCSVSDISPTLAAQLPKENQVSAQNKALAPVEYAQAAINNVASLEQSLEGLAHYMASLGESDRRAAMRMIDGLADDPERHAKTAAGIRAMVGAAFVPSPRKAA